MAGTGNVLFMIHRSVVRTLVRLKLRKLQSPVELGLGVRCGQVPITQESDIRFHPGEKSGATTY